MSEDGEIFPSQFSRIQGDVLSHFVQPAVKHPDTFKLQSHKTEKSGKVECLALLLNK